MVERATAAQLRYLERLLASANTAWPMIRHRWPEAPARYDELDQRQAGALIGTLRRHGHLPASHRLRDAAPRQSDINK